ncbi:MAG: hypothetical protein JXA42_02130 [Anaerolineales bacterium]|nr:hypothetical protein [Anaerolineales bacterium]
MIAIRDKQAKWVLPLLLVACLVAVTLLLWDDTPTGTACGQRSALSQREESLTGQGCTIFTVSHGDQVYFGGNGDWINFDSNYYWVDPGDSGYGAIYFGWPDNVQQGINEKGLAYDANGLPLSPVNTRPGLEPVYGSYGSYIIRILQECASVEEVLAWVQTHQWHQAMHDQMHFADATGDAVVISAGSDGELAFTHKPAGDSYLVSTNFNLANPANGSYPCWRYTRAEKLLEEINSHGELSAEKAASVLDAVHVATPSVWTIMSIVADLPRGLVYVYLFHQFDAPIVLNVADEIARSPEPGPLRDLFPAETLSQVDQAFHQLTVGRRARCNGAGLAWPALAVVSIIFFFWTAKSGIRNRSIWAPVVAVFGPIGLLIWRVTRWNALSNRAESEEEGPAVWKRSLVETVGDMPPYLIGFVISLLAILHLPEIGSSSLLQLLLDYGLPLAIGLFLYQGPLLVLATSGRYFNVLWHRLPAAIISTNLALAGLMAIAFPLISLLHKTCPLDGFSALLFWPIAVLGGLVGGLLLYMYHRWAIRRGFFAWSALVWGEEESGDTPAIVSPSWRRVWLWFVLGWAVLAAGIVVGAMGSMLMGRLQ